MYRSGEDAAAQVFISYVQEDSARVDRLQEMLEAAGITVWRDRTALRPGEDWRIEIRKAIRAGSVFIACFSEHSASRQSSVQYEELDLAAAVMKQRPPGKVWLLPVRFADCPVPSVDLGFGRSLESLQRVDLFDSDWDVGFARLVASVRDVCARTPGPDGPIVRSDIVSGESGPADLSDGSGRRADPSAEPTPASGRWRKRSGGKKLSWQQRLLGTVVALGLVVAAAVAIPASREYIVRSFLGILGSGAAAGHNSRILSPDKSEPIMLAFSPEYYHVAIALTNTGGRIQLASAARLTIDWDNGFVCGPPVPIVYNYRVTSPIYVRRGAIHLSVNQNPGYNVPATGHLTTDCGSTDMSFAFMPYDLRIQQSTITTVSISIPRKITLTSTDGPQGAGPLSTIEIPDVTGSPNAQVYASRDLLTIKLQVTTYSGSIFSACRIFYNGRSAACAT